MSTPETRVKPSTSAGRKAGRARMLAVLEFLRAVTGPARVSSPLIMGVAVHLRDPEVMRQVSALALRVVIADGEARCASRERLS